MILYVNENNEIKDVNTTSNPSLIPLKINDDELNPFKDWTIAKICCYKVAVSEEGTVTMFTPYIDSTIVEIIDKLGKEIKEQRAATQSNE